MIRVEDGHLLTDQWVLKIHGEFVLRKEYQPKIHPCGHCNGYGHTGGGPLSGDKETCYWCFGTGKVTDTSHITEPKPEIPIELVNHMKDAFQDWLRDKAVIDREDEFNPVAGI